MADRKILSILNRGINVWNNWRIKNWHIISPDLSGVELRDFYFSQADLSGVNFSQADLSGSNFSGSDLRGSNLSKANLSKSILSDSRVDKANFSEANLTEADLSRVRAIATKFYGTVFTGASIEDWHINSETIFHDLMCDYVYLNSQDEAIILSGKCNSLLDDFFASLARSNQQYSICKSINLPNSYSEFDSSKDRVLATQAVVDLLEAQFEALLFALNPPPGVIPSSSAPKLLRAVALLEWAKANNRCSLDHVLEIVELIQKKPIKSNE